MGPLKGMTSLNFLCFFINSFFLILLFDIGLIENRVS
jgi:hypothetical protein